MLTRAIVHDSTWPAPCARKRSTRGFLQLRESDTTLYLVERGAARYRTHGEEAVDRRWTCKEDLAVLYPKIKHRDELTSPQSHPAVWAPAKAIERTEASVATRIGNFNS